MPWRMHRREAGASVGSLLEVGEEPRKPTFFLEFTLIFAAVALALSLAAGFALAGFLSQDIRNKTLEDVKTDVEEVTARRVASQLPCSRSTGPSPAMP